jgi:hypothetical protein
MPELDPQGELPSPPFSSLSLFLFLPFPSLRAPFFSLARAPPCSPSRVAFGPRRRAPWRGLRPPLWRGSSAPRRGGPWPPLARGSLACPFPARRLGPLRAAPAPDGAAPAACTRPWPPGVAPAPGGAAPWPLARGPSAPVHGLCLRQRGPPAWPARPRASPFTQRVPACAAPRAQ